MAFSDIPIRANGESIEASWWNLIRTMLIAIESKIDAFLGAGASSTEATFAIADNTTAADITGLVASNLYRITRVKYWVLRKATDTVMESGELIIMFDGTNFALGRHAVETATTAGMSFDVNSSTGQVTYTSSDMAGSYDTVASKIGYTRTTQGTI